MEKIIKKLNFIDCKPYIKSSRSCKFGKTCFMEGKYGILNINLNPFHDATRCAIIARRISGNGKTFVSCGKTSFETDVLSQSSQNFSIDITNNKDIQLKRPHRSTGQIEILEIILYKEVLEEEVIDWGKILNNCKYKGIKVVGNKLLASEGAFIAASKINKISTSPKNAYKIENNIITFLYSCEIIKLSINQPGIIKTTFGSIQQSPPLDINNQPENQLTNITAPMVQQLTKKQTIDENHNPANNLVYDSSSSGWLENGSIVLNAGAEIVNNVLKFDHTGVARVNIPAIKPNTQYIALIETNKINGNGKLHVSIVPSTFKTPICLIGPIRKIINFNVKSGDGNSFQLEIKRPPAATGALIVSRVLLLTSLVSFELPQISHITTSPKVEENSIESVSKSFSTFYKETYRPLETFNIRGIIEPLTYSSNQWVNKILPYFPNIYIKSNSSYKKTHIDSDLVIGKLNNLKESKNILIEEFINKQISVEDKQILNKANKIFSTSLPNVQYLRKHFDVKVEYVSNIWPYVSPRPYINAKGYILYFNRNQSITHDLLKFVDNNMVIIGARGAYPANITPLGNYLPYDQLLSIILNAGCVLDLPECNHYMSGLLDFCFIAGVPIVTTNHWMSISKPKQFFIKSILKGNSLCPKFDDIPLALSNALQSKRKSNFDMSSYNKMLNALMHTLLGK